MPPVKDRISAAQKEEILAEVAKDGASIADVARRHGLLPKIVKRWRKIRRRDGEENEARCKYQPSDRDVVDYQYEPLEGCSFSVRGPVANGRQAGRSVACLGSAATFGRYVKRPYSSLLAERLGAHVTNLGFGGARFETYLKEPAVLAICKSCDLVVLELMSARSYGSDLFTPRDHLGRHGTIGEKFAARATGPSGKNKFAKDSIADSIYSWALEHLSAEELASCRSQLLDAYTRDAIALIKEIGRPVLLLWFSQREMDEVPTLEDYRNWSLGFPHFVDRDTVDAIARHAVGVVNVTSSTGIPFVLRAPVLDEYGKPKLDQPKTLMNRYYPSPEMHVEAAELLAAFIAAKWQAD